MDDRTQKNARPTGDAGASPAPTEGATPPTGTPAAAGTGPAGGAGAGPDTAAGADTAAGTGTGAATAGGTGGTGGDTRPDTGPEPYDERPWELPEYHHERELGAGASGRVVLAHHLATGTAVAIKYLHGSVGTPALRTEAEVLAGIDSPHVTRLYEYVEGERGSAIVMELVDGIALRDLLRAEGATTPEAALVVLKGSLLGLAAAHGAGVVHRDYKPANVLVDTAGTSKLVDFGIAVPSGDDRNVSGTPAYMAPEQWAGQPASPAADVYAATATFFECLTGARPFSGTTLAELAVQHTEAPIPAELAPDPVRPLILAGLAKDPESRPDSAATLVAKLEAVAATGYGPQWEEKGRRDLAALVALLALLLPGGAGAADGGTTLAHTTVGGPADPAGADQAVAGAAADAAPVATVVRATVPRRGPGLAGRGKALAGVTAGAAALAVLAGTALAGAADGGARTVLGGASPTATTTLGGPGPTDGTSPAPTGDPGTPSPAASGTETPTASPSASSGSPSAVTPSAVTPTSKGPVPPGTPPSGGAAPTTGLPPAPPTGAPPTTSPSPTIGPVRPTLTIAPVLSVGTVSLDSLVCSGRWSLSATVSVSATGLGSGTLTLTWYHRGATGGAINVFTDTVAIKPGMAPVTVRHDFGSADTYPTWGVRIATTPAAGKPGRTSAETAAYLCDPPR